MSLSKKNGERMVICPRKSWH